MELTLSTAERALLHQAMKQAASARLYRRLQAVLLAGEGVSATQIAAITGASARSVQNWCAAWRRSSQHLHPQKALEEQPRLGRRPGLPELDHTRLLTELTKDPPSLGYAATNWTVPLLATHLRRQGWAVSQRTLRRRLHAAGVRWKRPRFVFAEPELHVAQKKGRSFAEANRRYLIIQPLLLTTSLPDDLPLPVGAPVIRTVRRWITAWHQAEATCGCGYAGLLPG